MVIFLCVLFATIVLVSCLKVASDPNGDTERAIDKWIDEQGSKKSDESMRISHD